MIEMLRFLGKKLGKIYEIRYNLYFTGYDFDIIFEGRCDTLRDVTNIRLAIYFLSKINYI